MTWNCKNYEPDPCHVPALSYFLGKPVSYWTDLEAAHSRLRDMLTTKCAHFDTLKLNYDNLYDEHQRTLKELNDIKDLVKMYSSPPPQTTTFMGKPLEYWVYLQAENSNLRAENNELLAFKERVDEFAKTL